MGFSGALLLRHCVSAVGNAVEISLHFIALSLKYCRVPAAAGSEEVDSLFSLTYPLSKQCISLLSYSSDSVCAAARGVL